MQYFKRTLKCMSFYPADFNQQPASKIEIEEKKLAFLILKEKI